MKPKQKLPSHSKKSENNRHANKFLSYDNYFHFSNCATTTFASVSGRSLVTSRVYYNFTTYKLFIKYVVHTGSKLRSDAHAYNLRNSDHLNIPKCRTVAAQRGFFYRATKSWNNLSSETRSAQTLRSFKKLAKAELKLSQKVK